MCEFTHLLASIQDAMDEGCDYIVNFLVQEIKADQEKQGVARNEDDAQTDNISIPSNTIEPDDGYCMDYGHDKEVKK